MPLSLFIPNLSQWKLSLVHICVLNSIRWKFVKHNQSVVGGKEMEFFWTGWRIYLSLDSQRLFLVRLLCSAVELFSYLWSICSFQQIIFSLFGDLFPGGFSTYLPDYILFIYFCSTAFYHPHIFSIFYLCDLLFCTALITSRLFLP